MQQYNNINIKILTKKELQLILINNNDNYYNTFSDLDLYVRNVKNIKEYKQKIMLAPININKPLQNKIKETVQKINLLFYNYKIVGFDGKKANKIPWIIGIIDNNIYENGLPHTRDDTIILPKNILTSDNLLSTLIHEKIHIYQKLYPNDINKYLKYNNFIKINKIYKNKRANPDIDNYIYMRNNKEYKCLYNIPNDFNDVIYYPINKSRYEHPFEYMAYKIQKNIL